MVLIDVLVKRTTHLPVLALALNPSPALPTPPPSELGEWGQLPVLPDSLPIEPETGIDLCSNRLPYGASCNACREALQ